MNAAAVRVLGTRVSTRRFAAGATLWRAGEKPTALYVVLEGEVRVVRAIEGRQHVVHAETAGGTLADVALFAGTTYPATAVAATRTICGVVDEAALHAIIAADPQFAFRLLNRLAERVQGLIGRLERSTAWPVQTRLAEHLLQRHDRAEGRAFTLGGTQQEIAEELGTVREVIVRTLRQLREAGFLETSGRGRYRVIDAAGLKQLQQRDPNPPEQKLPSPGEPG